MWLLMLLISIILYQVVKEWFDFNIDLDLDERHLP